MSSARVRIIKEMGRARHASKRGPPPPPIKKWNIVRGDRVQVLPPHASAGKQGIVSSVYRLKSRLTVEGVNIHPKYIKANKERGIPGRVMYEERTIPYSMVNLVDPVTNQPTRIVRKILEDGSKVRVSKKSGAIIPRPEILLQRTKPKSTHVTDRDTEAYAVWDTTYQPKV
jgi:large subunit ribosomal protein L24